MKIATVTPSFGRPNFLAQCQKYLFNQQTNIHTSHFVTFEKTLQTDLTLRYKSGCNDTSICMDKNDVIFFIEDDDWYSPFYIERMITEWNLAGQPELFGIDSTIYYHLKLKKYVKLSHPRRSSMFCTMIKVSALDKIKWPSDDTLFLDLQLWRQLNGKTCSIDSPIAVGIKHGLGQCGGKGHLEDFKRYETDGIDDSEWNYLRSIVGQDDLKFYQDIIEKGEP